MHFGFFTVHPLTVPVGNELAHAIAATFSQGWLVYTGIVEPKILELQEIVKLL